MDGYDTTKYYRAFVTSDISFKHIAYRDNVKKVQAGVDLKVFEWKTVFGTVVIPPNPRVGWVGAMSGHKEKKGYEEFYLPLGKHFTLKPHLKEKDYVKNHSDMANYYSHIDVLVCTSSWEGYPMPIMEASAMGIPVISTKVGVAPEILPSHQIVERTVQAFVKRIKDREFVIPNMSKWDWNIKIKKWEDAIK